MSDPVEILTQARDLIADETKWTRGNLAKRAGSNDGMCDVGTHPLAEEATCFCALGAVIRSGYSEKIGPEEEVIYEDSYAYVDVTQAGIKPEVKVAMIALAKAACEALGKSTSYPGGYALVYNVNDRKEAKHSDVMAMFDAAIEKAKG